MYIHINTEISYISMFLFNFSFLEWLSQKRKPSIYDSVGEEWNVFASVFGMKSHWNAIARKCKFAL